MTDETSTSSSPTRSAGLTRRRALQGAAWSVPVITVAAAAPAYAMSLTPPSVAATTVVLTNGGRVNHTVTLINSTAQATTALVVRCVLTYSGLEPRAYDFGEFDSAISPGWALQGDGKASGKTLDLTFLRTGEQLAGNGTLMLEFLCVQPAPPIGSTTTTVFPTPGTGAGGTAPWVVV